jgi:hypothetical protein
MFLLLLFTLFQVQTYDIEDGFYILIGSSKDNITFSSYRLSNPERIVLEINGQLTISFENVSSPVKKVETNTRKEFTRLIFHVEDNSFYTVLNRGNQILVGFRDKLFLDHEDFDSIAAVIEKKKVEPEENPEKKDESELVKTMMLELELSRKRQEENRKRLAEIEKQRAEQLEREQLERQKVAKEKEAEKEKLIAKERERLQKERALRKIEEEKTKLADIERKRLAEEQARLAEVEKKKLAEEQVRLAEVEKKKLAEEQARLAEVEKKKLAEEQARLAEVEKKKLAEEQTRLAEIERKKLEEERVRLAEIEKKKLEEEKLRLAEIEKKKLEEERVRLAEIERKKLEEERVRLAEIERKKIEEERLRIAELEKKIAAERVLVQKRAVKTEDGQIRHLTVVKPEGEPLISEKMTRLPVKKIGERGVLKNLSFRKFPEFSRVSLEISGDIDYQFREIKGGFVIDIRNFGKIPQHILNIIDTRAFNAEVEYIYPKRVDDVFKIYIKADPGTAVRKSEDGNILNLDFFVPTIK